eukprot:230874_1
MSIWNEWSDDEVSGVIYALLSMICIGVFAVPQKLKVVRECKLHPTIFFLYFNAGILLVTLSCIGYLEFSHTYYKWTYNGIISGALAVGAVLSSIIAIPLIGLALAQTSWHGATLITSFIAGTTLDRKPTNLIACILAIIGIIFGITLIVYSVKIGEYFNRKNNTNQYKNSESHCDLILPKPKLTDTMEDGILPLPEANSTQSNSNKNRNWILGIIACIFVGLFGGWMLIPETYESPDSKNLKYMPSYGLSMVILGELSVLLYWTFKRQKPNFHFKKTFVPGIISGILWGIANVINIYAIEFIGYAIAFPIRQCGIIIASIFGVFVFGEITHKVSIFIFWSGELVVIIMMLLLVVYGV